MIVNRFHTGSEERIYPDLQARKGRHAFCRRGDDLTRRTTNLRLFKSIGRGNLSAAIYQKQGSLL